MKAKIDSILKLAFEKQASDIHLSVGVPPVMRINGELVRIGENMLMPADTEEMAKAMISSAKWSLFEEKGELDFSYGIPGVSRFRVNAFRQRSCISLAVRIVPRNIPSIDDLQLPSILKSIVEKPHGLILVTGPTGSGKSTTLASMISFMNQTMKRHVITLEDPIEYLHKHQKCIVDQREVGFDTGSFASGLKAALRQDPDVILVGELRDLETIHTAITAAETGHLVLGTLHTSSAASTVDRIIDVFPANQQPQIRLQLASVLIGVISQRLFPTVDKSGRRAVTEILLNNSAVASLIRNEKTYQIPSVIQTSRAQGMQTFESSLSEYVKAGVISSEAALPYKQGTTD
ncbi:type IV pilus twitching motility protein PilT [Metabacillus endolithicus]|uniref:Type IV pilus twitching motility protein PilT n=1 Tax=Metabacillus endolithicus TaxID=1535204 RepID=A0ABW5BY95_9BACI|nr:type IV pilus twitching motility protein PilT [Metabacillus endolithicus]UPG64700.1 type IV pilus twitching motility protein PilT [Metabacillus endolithicus]